MRRPAQWILCLLLFLWMGVKMSQKIDLTTADVGRHIVNGAMVLRSAADRDGVLYTNFYSYTMPNQPFVNHHWLTGVVFYLVWQLFRFPGLSVLTILSSLIAFALFFDIARRAGSVVLALIFGIVTNPLVTVRFDMRPEAFTSLLSGLFLWILWMYRVGRISPRWLYALPPLMLLWVNLHIGFVFGFLVLGAFLLDARIPKPLPKPETTRSGKKKTPPAPIQPAESVKSAEWKPLARVTGLCVVAALINPAFLRGFLYPLTIFNSYGYRIVENASVPYLERLGLSNAQPLTLFEIAAGAFLLSCLVGAIANWRKLDLALLTPALVTSVMAFLAIRNFAMFAQFALPAFTSTWIAIRTSSPRLYASLRYFILALAAAAVAISGWNQSQTFPIYVPTLGFGILPGAEGSADFFVRNHISGPIFNNYDIGGYLIYKLSLDGPNHRVFVDNRPEAYSLDFFQNVYKPAQLDDSAWHQLDNRYRFNAIFFSHRDGTPWARSFLTHRSTDPAWAAVYADDYNVIFVRRENLGNTPLIQQYELKFRMGS